MSSPELAHLLDDARACADACEAYLATSPTDAVIVAAAACRVLDELRESHPQLLLPAVRVCAELALGAVEEAPSLEEPLRRVAASASAVLDSSG